MHKIAVSSCSNSMDMGFRQQQVIIESWLHVRGVTKIPKATIVGQIYYYDFRCGYSSEIGDICNVGRMSPAIQGLGSGLFQVRHVLSVHSVRYPSDCEEEQVSEASVCLFFDDGLTIFLRNRQFCSHNVCVCNSFRTASL